MKTVVFVSFLLCLSCAHGTVANATAKKYNCQTACPAPPKHLRCKLACSDGFYVDCANAEFNSIADAQLEIWEKYFANCPANPSWTILLDSNRIERLTPIPNQENATVLKLKGNQISEIEPKVFTNLPALTDVDLSENMLTGESIRPDIFIGPWVKEQYEPLAIEVLRLGQNNIHSISHNTFEHLPKLRELHLHNNPLKVLDEHTSTAITSLPSLEWLSLSNCGLRKVAFPAKSPLLSLYLNNNLIEAVPKDLPANLKYLNLNGNPISSLGAGAFSNLPKLEVLIISGMPNLTVIDAEAFRGLSSLRTFVANYNILVSEISPKAFDAMGSNWTLKEVSLAWSSLKQLPRSLLPWSRMERLDVRGNPLTCDNDVWSAEAIAVIRNTERADGLLEEQQSCRSWRLSAPQAQGAPRYRASMSLSTIVRTLLIGVSAAVVIVTAMALVVVAIRKAQSERHGGPLLMVHYRRTHVLLRNP